MRWRLTGTKAVRIHEAPGCLPKYLLALLGALSPQEGRFEQGLARACHPHRCAYAICPGSMKASEKIRQPNRV